MTLKITVLETEKGMGMGTRKDLTKIFEIFVIMEIYEIIMIIIITDMKIVITEIKITETRMAEMTLYLISIIKIWIIAI